jgi:hypothetical protein
MQQVSATAWHAGKVVEAAGKVSSAHRKPKLLDRMPEAMRSRHYSRKTHPILSGDSSHSYGVLNRGGKGVRSPVDAL